MPARKTPQKKKQVVESSSSSSDESSSEESPQPKRKNQKRKKAESDEDEPAPSQRGKRKGKDILDANTKGKAVNDVMRLILFHDLHKHPVKRADINANIMKDHKTATGAVIEAAQKKFRDIFGFDLVETEKSKGTYVLTNLLKSQAKNKEEHFAEHKSEEWRDQQDALLMIILGVIHTNNGFIEEEALMDELKRLDFQLNEKHLVFDEWKKLIDHQFAKELYLVRRKNQSGIYEYKPGPRAYHDIPKKNIVYWIAEAYGEEVDEVELKAAEEGDDSSSSSDSDSGSSSGEEEVAPSQSQRAASQSQASPSQRGGRGRGRGRGRG
eukprot:TRINITY_DN3675_c0_g1_i1.p1 TRINITY_DN3675_c0_g1~~TRINITY_DN3675_c0_g1_i1.p1  ORF type:complete len:337 (+),score=123.00 TRINITY_DN3675_c0_g1_i1:42-1013(+)